MVQGYTVLYKGAPPGAHPQKVKEATQTLSGHLTTE